MNSTFSSRNLGTRSQRGPRSSSKKPSWSLFNRLSQSYNDVDDTVRTICLCALVATMFVLTIVSGYRTFVGLDAFLAPKVVAPSATEDFKTFIGVSTATTFFIALGTTFAIQSMMFATSYLFSRSLLALRPLSASGSEAVQPSSISRGGVQPHFSNQVGNHARRAWRGLASLSGFLLALSIFCVLGAIWRSVGWPSILSFGGLTQPIYQFFGFERPLVEDGGFDHFVVLWLVCACVALMIGGYVKMRWSGALIALLFIIFVGCLSVSWLFAFDAYYRNMRSPLEIQIESREVTGARTSDIITGVDDALQTVIAREKATLPKLSAFRKYISDMNVLDKASKNFTAEIASAARLAREARDEARSVELQRLQGLQKQANKASQRKAQLQLELNGIDGKVQQQEQLRNRLQQEIDAISQSIAPQRVEMEKQLAEAEAQEAGIGSRAPKCRTKCKAAEAKAERIDNFIKEREAAIDSKRKQISTAESEIGKLRGRKAVIPGEIALQTTLMADAKPDSKTTPQVPATPQSKPAGGQKPIDLPTAVSNFSLSPNVSTFKILAQECATVRSALSSQPELVANTECAPPEVRSKLDRIVSREEALKQFAEVCRDKSRTLGDIPDALTFARTCIQKSQLTGGDLNGLSNDLIQLRNEYASPGHDLRRTWSNLWERGEKFAIFAAIIALFMDLLILLCSFVYALMHENPLMKKREELSAEDLDRSLKGVIDVYRVSLDRSAAARKFIKYCAFEAGPTPNFKHTLSLNDVEDNDKELIKGILFAGGVFVQPVSDDPATAAGAGGKAGETISKYRIEGRLMDFFYRFPRDGDDVERQTSKNNQETKKGPNENRKHDLGKFEWLLNNPTSPVEEDKPVAKPAEPVSRRANQKSTNQQTYEPQQAPPREPPKTKRKRPA